MRATLEKFGGHEMAAGLALHEENFRSLPRRFARTARELLSEEALQRSLRLDHELPFTNIDVELLRWHELLQPFGNGNPQPLFFARAVEPVGSLESQTKSIYISIAPGRPHRRAVYFDGAANEFPPPPWDVAFRIGVDEYGGETLVGMRIEACAQPRRHEGTQFEWQTSVSTNLEDLSWIPRPRLLALATARDRDHGRFANAFPADVMRIGPSSHSFPGKKLTLPSVSCGEVIKTSLRRIWRLERKSFEATLEESHPNALSEPLVCRWFNLHYVQKMIATGQRIVVFGRPRLRGKRICMDHPEFEVIENDEEISIHFRRITPIYPATEGLSQRVLRGIIYRVLHEFQTQDGNRSPRALWCAASDGSDSSGTFSRSWEARNAAREHLVLSEFFAMQMLIASRRFRVIRPIGAAHCGSGTLLEKFLKALPFELTAAQRKVISEIRRDLAANYPMNRLLQGDVGSGKTVVAIAAMLLALKRDIRPRSWRRRKFWPSNITKYCGVGSSRWASASHYEQQQGRKRSGPLPLFARMKSGSARLQRAGR
jgi:hypothetical protein